MQTSSSPPEYREFDVWEWVESEQLPEMIVPFMRQLYLDVLAEFGAHLSLHARSRKRRQSESQAGPMAIKERHLRLGSVLWHAR